MVAIDEVNGPVNYVEEGPDVEHVTSFLKNRFRHEILRRNVRDATRMELVVWTDVAKDTMMAMVRLAMMIKESTSGVIGHGLISNSMTHFHDELWRTMFSLSSRLAESKMQVDDVSCERKVGDVSGRCT